MKRELQRQLVVLMACRAVLLTVLLASGLVIGRLLGQPLLASGYFYLLTGIGYGLTILYALLQPLWSRRRSAGYVQVAGDIILITGFVYVTGGIHSPFSLLYFLPIIAAGIMLGRAGAVSSATGAWMMYAFLAVLLVNGWIHGAPASAWSRDATAEPASRAAMDRDVAYGLFSHFLAFFTVAQLSSYLVRKLEAAGDQLEENREVLAKLQALHGNIVGSISSGIITTDAGGKITFMNAGAEEITGRRFQEVVSQPIEVFLLQEDDFIDRVKRELARSRRYRFETSMIRPDGTDLFLGFTSALLKNERGELSGHIFSFQDLTEIKALEEEVRFKDRMAALGEMAAGIAHEIRNPLASMSGSVQILKKTLKTEGEEDELLDIVLRESRRLDGIIRDFLLFTKPKKFDPRPADLVPLLDDALRLLANSEELSQEHQLKKDFDEKGVFAAVDPDLIRQVFWNLAKNGLKAMPGGGTLTVRARNEGSSTASVTFADEGVGMDETEVRRAFQPFHGRFMEGTGLGLSVVFRIVQEHRGRIDVSSRPGQGTEVKVTLPAAEMRQAAMGRMAGAAS